MQTLVTTASVLRPSGSISLAILSASEVAMSALAGETARMMELGFWMYFRISVLIWASMSSGCSPTATWGGWRIKDQELEIKDYGLILDGLGQGRRGKID